MTDSTNPWMPFETAPRDNTPIQVTWATDWPRIEVVALWEGGHPFNVNSGNYMRLGLRPTHWMPLPCPPEGADVD